MREVPLAMLIFREGEFRGVLRTPLCGSWQWASHMKRDREQETRSVLNTNLNYDC